MKRIRIALIAMCISLLGFAGACGDAFAPPDQTAVNQATQFIVNQINKLASIFFASADCQELTNALDQLASGIAEPCPQGGTLSLNRDNFQCDDSNGLDASVRINFGYSRCVDNGFDVNGGWQTDYNFDGFTVSTVSDTSLFGLAPFLINDIDYQTNIFLVVAPLTVSINQNGIGCSGQLQANGFVCDVDPLCDACPFPNE